MKKFLALLLAVVMILVVVSCGKKTPTDTKPDTKPDDKPGDNTGETAKYERDADEDIYEAILGDYEAMIAAAKAAESIDEKFVLYAQAEAYLLDAAVMVPTFTQGGAYTFSRIAPHTVPYVQWGNDDDRVKSLVIANEIITKADRDALLDQWSKACLGEGVYDPAAYLTNNGYTLRNEYKTTFQTAPVTFDWLNTSSQADTEITVNTVDGLVEYDNLNKMNPALATDWTVSEDGLTYTFKIREGVYWYTAEGTPYAELTAEDFEAGFRHMLDTQAGLEWLVEGVIKGVGSTYKYDENGKVIMTTNDDGEEEPEIDVPGYLYDGGAWENVGYKATDKYTLTITLTAPTSYFMTMLTYSCFLPLCKSFYESKGGVFGIDEYKAVVSSVNDDTGEITFVDSYTYGVNTSVANQVYCGAFLIQQFSADSQIVLVKNPNYYNADKVTMNTLTWVYDNDEDPLQSYEDAKNGVYPGTGLVESTGTLAKAKEDKLEGDEETIFEKYVYVSDTNSTTYFGGLNLNRGTYALASGAVASPKTEQQKIDTDTAMQNKNFRQAMLFAFDRATWNGVTRGEDLKATNLRNMYTHPEFVSLSNDVTVDGKEWKAGTFYGEMVQYYLEQLGSHIKVADQQDGWFNADLAKEKLDAAKTELTAAGVTFPITIDLVYYSGSPSQIAQAQAYKQGIEEVLGAENVVVNLIEATTSTDYYASGYRAKNGKAGNFDMYYGSGWGPDYGDPSTYLDTFLGYGAGYMTRVIGLF